MSDDSFADLLSKLSQDIEQEQIDFQAVVGELKGKIDAIKELIDKWEAEADMMDERWIKVFQRRRDALRNRAKSLQNYVKVEMLKNDWLECYGNAWKFKIQNGTPSVEITRDPGPADYMTMPNIVNQSIVYTWDKKEIATRLKAGEAIDGASLKQTKVLRDYPR